MNSDNEFIKIPKLEYLEPLKPLNLEKLKMNVSGISGTRGFGTCDSEGSKTFGPGSQDPKDQSLFTPINVFGNSSEPKVPDVLEQKLRHGDMEPKVLNLPNTYGFKNKKPRNSKILNPLYYKTRSMHAEYNSLMNSLYPGTDTSGSGGLEHTEPKVLEPPEPDVSEDPIENPEKPEQNNVPNVPNVLEVPNIQETYNQKNPNRTTFQKSHEPLNDQNRQKFRASLQELFEASEASRNVLECSKAIKPKEYDLNESLIEVLDISKKSCVVWYEGITIPYAKFRENPEHIIFFVGEDAYGYSKKLLFEEYTKSNSSMYSDRSIYFDLNLNWEDNETLWIPMSQIAKLLEFSHPVYEIQKMKYSMSVWNLIPVKLKK
jgi:hypothetical protein